MDRLQGSLELSVVEGHEPTVPHQDFDALSDSGETAGELAAAEGLAGARVAGSHRIAAARGHLHERAGDLGAAVALYRHAADGTTGPGRSGSPVPDLLAVAARGDTT